MPILLRGFAIIIAVLGVLDPAITSKRRVRPEVSVIATDSSSAALAGQVTDRLADRFAVIPAPFAPAAATILVGRNLPASSADIAGVAFAVVPEPARLSIEAVQAPAHMDLSTRASVTADVRILNVKSRDVQVGLHVDEVVLDRIVHSVADDDQVLPVPLQFVPTVPGPTLLRVMAIVDDDTATADLVVDVRQQHHSILFYDPRPSWLSTFVRRAIEEDPRFVVNSRTVTSRAISVDAGTPPPALTDRTALERYNVVVVGAPELLSTADVDALDQFLRRRGGIVVLLPDNNTRGQIDRLVGVQRWTTPRISRPVAIGEGITLRAGSVLVPLPLPAAALPIAHDSSSQAPVVWEKAIGAGRLIVSGALDAWRYRDPAQSQFDVFWRELLALAGSHAMPSISIDLAAQPVAPGGSTDFTVTIRDLALGPVQPGGRPGPVVSAALVTQESRIPVRLYPEGRPGRFSGTLDVPDAAGTYAIVVTANGATAETRIVVAPHSRARRDEAGLLDPLTAACGGQVIRAGELDQLVSALERVVQTEVRREWWYPLRSAWWLIPFTLLLAAEWWLRRRRGLL